MTIELATSLIFLITSIYGPATTTDTVLQKEVNKINQPQQEVSIIGPETLEEHVKDYFKDDPILAEIAKCESTYRQFKVNGHVVRGLVNSYDVGVMQINEKYHAEQAEEQGFDIYTLDGNLAYAKWLYDKEGVKPWMSSAKCWQNTIDGKMALNNEKNSK